MTHLKRCYVAAIGAATVASNAVAQVATPDTAADEAVVPSLFSFTFFAVLLVALIALGYFLRRRSNRDATAKGLGLKSGSVNRPNETE